MNVNNIYVVGNETSAHYTFIDKKENRGKKYSFLSTDINKIREKLERFVETHNFLPIYKTP